MDSALRSLHNLNVMRVDPCLLEDVFLLRKLSCVCLMHKSVCRVQGNWGKQSVTASLSDVSSQAAHLMFKSVLSMPVIQVNDLAVNLSNASFNTSAPVCAGYFHTSYLLLFSAS